MTHMTHIYTSDPGEAAKAARPRKGTTPVTDLAAAAQACIDHIHDVDNVSFAELERVLERHDIPVHGDYVVEFPSMPNMLLWCGMSREFVTITEAIDRHPHIDWKPTHYLVYLADGRYPNLPLAKRPHKGGYKKPHWLPTVYVWTKPRTHQERLDIARAALTVTTP